jgi:kinetochore protein Nuf2
VARPISNKTQPDKEIAGCINDIGIPFSPSDLAKPNAQQIQMVFEWFAELLMNTTRETVEPAMHVAAEDICGDYPDIVPNDTRNLMGFFVNVRKLLAEVSSPCALQWGLKWLIN